jgi:hypothetical protein
MRARAAILDDARRLHHAWRAGGLGGETMPEDAHPDLPRDSEVLATFLTLGMCLNYKRNSYTLWRSCAAAFDDPKANWVFDPDAVSAAAPSDLQAALLKHRVALQPNRHPQIWRRNAQSLLEAGGVRAIFQTCGHDLAEVRAFIVGRRPNFPYLAGPKIVNYWLYVVSQYLTWPMVGRERLSVAPDRHVIAASRQLGLIPPGDDLDSALALTVAEQWRALLDETELSPIDLHTPLWLWSRLGFPALETLVSKSAQHVRGRII